MAPKHISSHTQHKQTHDTGKIRFLRPTHCMCIGKILHSNSLPCPRSRAPPTGLPPPSPYDQRARNPEQAVPSSLWASERQRPCCSQLGSYLPRTNRTTARMPCFCFVCLRVHATTGEGSGKRGTGSRGGRDQGCVGGWVRCGGVGDDHLQMFHRPRRFS